MIMWNPWHGCHKISAGCKHCYVYRQDAMFGTELPSDSIRLTGAYRLPLNRNRQRQYKFPSGTLFNLCFTSDFLLEEADIWRNETWQIIRERSDCSFFFITKRINRMQQCLPDDWADGYTNLSVGCTVENQDRADFRLPIFLDLPIPHRSIIVAPMLESINLQKYLDPKLIEAVSVGGESGSEARVIDYSWVLDIRQQCIEAGIPFNFHQTGSHLIKDGRLYRIPRAYQHSQARKAGIDIQ